MLVMVELRLATSLASLATSQLTVELTCVTPLLVSADGVTDGPECKKLLWRVCAGRMGMCQTMHGHMTTSTPHAAHHAKEVSVAKI